MRRRHCSPATRASDIISIAAAPFSHCPSLHLQQHTRRIHKLFTTYRTDASIRFSAPFTSSRFPFLLSALSAIESSFYLLFYLKRHTLSIALYFSCLLCSAASCKLLFLLNFSADSQHLNSSLPAVLSCPLIPSLLSSPPLLLSFSPSPPLLLIPRHSPEPAYAYWPCPAPSLQMHFTDPTMIAREAPPLPSISLGSEPNTGGKSPRGVGGSKDLKGQGTNI